MTLPNEIPAMALPGVVLFPKTIMPLRIFEAKYREMLADALADDRIFAVANQKSELSSKTKTPYKLELHSVATVGLIRMSNQNPDGTSILMLEGTERVRIDDIIHEDPYPKLRVTPLPTTNRPEDETEAEIVVDILGKIDEINDLLGPDNDQTADACHNIDDLEMLIHFILQSYCTSSTVQQNALAATDLVERCRITSDYLALQITLMNDEEIDDDED